MSKFWKNSRKNSVILVLIIIIVACIPTAKSNPTQVIDIQKKQYDLFNQKLYVTIPSSLQAYYSNLSHRIPDDSAYAKFITPQAVQPIADSIQKITGKMHYSDEMFANAVLTFVHQIPYNITGAKFPIETLLDNQGDCAALSLLAASIMMAGGLDVVLIKYVGINPGHMNVGVYLPYTPIYHNPLMGATSFEYNNKTYWTAEATPQGDWKVGDQSYSMVVASAIIIPLDKYEPTSPGQVSASFTSLQPSSITVNILPQSTDAQSKQRALVIAGAIEPANPDSIVTLYINKNGSYSDYFQTTTDSTGAYTFTWNFTQSGTYSITANWSGSESTAGADSETLTAFIGPESLLQFQTDSYNYIYGVTSFGDIAVRPYRGVSDFANIPLSTNVSVSYNFILVQTGHTAMDIETQTVTLPASQHIIGTGNRRTQIITTPSRTVIAPVNVPPGYEALRLPDDFNQTVNNKFSFIFKTNINGNCSLNVQGLNDYDLAKEKQETDGYTYLLNATRNIQENTWYKVTSTLTDYGITTTLQTADGIPLTSTSTPYRSEGAKQLILLIANNIDNAVIMKNLKIQPATPATYQPEPQSIKKTPGNLELPLSSICIMALLAITFIATILFVKKKKKQHNQAN
ncbi:MAG: Ig-like domain-containing protein [Candidatus Bathyarchaeota archaeon]|nr:Ig-like domain-containing protein [Candidatus Bathyarchaeota archaeon]